MSQMVNLTAIAEQWTEVAVPTTPFAIQPRGGIIEWWVGTAVPTLTGGTKAAGFTLGSEKKEQITVDTGDRLFVRAIGNSNVPFVIWK